LIFDSKQTMNEQLNKDKWYFSLYDFSNSGYVLIFQSFLFPIFLISLNQDYIANTTALWSWIVAISTVIAIILSPFIGKLADIRNRSLVFAFLVLITGVTAIFTPIIFSNSIILIVISFIIFNCTFELSQTVYDSFLKNFAKDSNIITSISTFAWGFGYLGGVLFAVVYLMLNKLELSTNVILSFSAFMYLIISVPSILYFRKTIDNKPIEAHKFRNLLKVRPPIPWSKIIIYWIIADCVGTIIYFAGLFAHSEIGLEVNTIGMLMLATQLLALPLTILSGKVANRIGHIRTIQLCLIVWSFILIGLFFASSLIHMILLMILVAFVIGSTQSILRAKYANNVNRDNASQGFGFYAVAQKSAAVVSPLLVGAVILLTGQIRFAFIIIFILVIIAIILSGKLEKDVIS